MLAYQEWIVSLGRRLMRLLALSLDLAEDYFDEALDGLSCSVRLLHYPPHPTDAEIRERMSGNICRCAAYPNIVAAIKQAAGIQS